MLVAPWVDEDEALAAGQMAVIALLTRWLNKESAVRRMAVLACWVNKESVARRMAVPSPAQRRVGGSACSLLASTTTSRQWGGWRCLLCLLASSTMRGPMAMERNVELAVEFLAVLARCLLAQQQVGLAGSTKSQQQGGWRGLLIGATSSRRRG